MNTSIPREKYTLSLSKAYSALGADMGRSEYGLAEYRALGDSAPKLHLTRVHLDSGGYDAGGAYWGIPFLYAYDLIHKKGAGFLYCAECDLDNDQTTPVRLFVRAWDHEQAKQIVIKQLSNARFYR